MEEEKNQSELIKTLLGKVDELSKQNEMLMDVADKKALSAYYSRNQKALPKIVRLNTIDGKVIVGSKMIRNDVYKENIGGNYIWREKQSVKLLFEDGTEGEMSYSDYVKAYQQVEAKVVSKTEDEATGGLTLKVVRTDNGKEVSVGVEYIN